MSITGCAHSSKSFFETASIRQVEYEGKAGYRCTHSLTSEWTRSSKRTKQVVNGHSDLAIISTMGLLYRHVSYVVIGTINIKVNLNLFTKEK